MTSKPGEATVRLSSDISPLRRVLVHRPGPETLKVTTALHGDHPMIASELMPASAFDEHKGLVETLRSSGAEVVFLEEVLDEAVTAAREAGALQGWLGAHASRLAPLHDEVTAAMLLGADDATAYHHGDDASMHPLADPMKWIFYTRDIAVMTSRGVIVANFINHNRSFEGALAGLAFRWSPSLSGYPIAFDGIEENAYLQGGDMIVAGEDLIFMGVGSLTQRSAAEALARKMDMNVIAVQMPGTSSFREGEGYANWNGLRSLFLHLDTIFNLVDERTALMVPYFLEDKYTGADGLTDVMKWMGAEGVAGADDVAALLPDLGRLTLYEASSGKAELLEGKLADHLTRLGYQIVFTGGESPSQPGPAMTKHLIERVLREVGFQGTNVVATEPGKVIAYEGNTHTIDALSAAGIEVTTITGEGLMRWNGGPHCMTCPLERQ